MSNSAQKAEATPPSSERIEQFLTFQLAGQRYGVEILRVQEIKGWEKPTRLPHSPSHVQGVINLRGAVVPILDLRERFALGQAEYGRTTVVIVVKVATSRGELTAGMVVDGVCEVCNLSGQDLRPPPEMAVAIETDLVRGLAMVEDRMLILLDVGRLVTSALGEQAVADASKAA